MKVEREQINLLSEYFVCFFSIGPFIYLGNYLHELITQKPTDDFNFMQLIGLSFSIAVLLFVYKKATVLKVILVLHIIVGVFALALATNLTVLIHPFIDTSHTTIPGLVQNVFFMLLFFAIMPVAIFGLGIGLAKSYRKISKHLESKSNVEESPSVN